MYAGGVTERSKILRRHPQGRYGTPPWRLEPHSGGSILVITGGSLLASAEGLQDWSRSMLSTYLWRRSRHASLS